MIVGAKGLKRVFMFGKFKSKKPSVKKLGNTKASNYDTKADKNFNKRSGTSGSDVSVIRNENLSGAQNRNSSSG